MRILVVHFFDDNYGDMLIGTCFRRLLKVVLKNVGISADEYSFSGMSIKDVDPELVKGSDYVFFAGGGLFGLSYLGFSDSLELILDIADKEGIPVVFSSMGINNMDADTEGEEKLKSLMHKGCIKAVSVRENKKLFDTYAEGCGFNVREVCDPVVWARYIFDKKPERDDKEHTPIVGINVVRGGLFKDNGHDFSYSQELEYLDELSKKLDKKGIKYELYTNGSFLDNNTLTQYVYEYDIEDDKIKRIRSAKELMETVAGYDAVAAIRMHSSILSYAFGVPSINLVWNDKIPLFYENTGRSENAISIEKWSAEFVAEWIERNIKTETVLPDKEYLMSLYDFLYEAVKGFGLGQDNKSYDFDKIVSELKNTDEVDDTSEIDTACYIMRAERNYARIFRKNQEKRERIWALTEKNTQHRDKIRELREIIKKKNERIDKQKEEINELKSKRILGRRKKQI